MPANAYVVLALFSVVAVLCGIGAAWIVGPRRALAVIIPAMCAFLALFWVGHRSGLELGPTVEIAGFRVALVQDVLAGAIGALLGAVGQRWVLDRRRVHPDRGSQAR
jgi:hypothetical protein